ncbi:hypothetical protein H7U32_02920 [Bifidobacterium pullorum subsp. saeculare]|uniref:Uncharacterized protein n=1 Tax=Bifidobacterium pullorum subsp. saeculare TaxID=78257 RepID=A0A938WWT6_9BIFI|nr:hypothetical protein [Bifidobacterium pullorum]MBM6699296.1 hypothetical protein [Bifidobacterium pullorum subsp. saeculare]
MPWWVWLVLALFMLAMLVAGLAYAALHAFRGVKSLSDVGGCLGERVAKLSQPSPDGAADEAPFFTRPLTDATDRYADAHAAVLARKAAKRERHAERWARWRRFNND